ncbi:hypothetical protein HBI56_156730 [Parastagonospora nodorum]|nr:hypothetical protein HBH53_070060 [Parastagonospora nodorum]KAH3974071.1 hypothetical protein HBH52_141760 [Parastagonospora nodorum]KAH3998687.1 hypothetical protein HBI10_128710 [Parastagonospora nodorum]KAH4023923.1 hypothetical protein HBI13_080840 [Parastagonospora nodorum]KAH4033647.1 hypothetical protein HBI09_111150 [Parastagonospora nodorum]
MGLSVRTFLTSIVRVNNTRGNFMQWCARNIARTTCLNSLHVCTFLFTRLGVLDLGSVSRHERGRRRGLEGGSDSAVS